MKAVLVAGLFIVWFWLSLVGVVGALEGVEVMPLGKVIPKGKWAILVPPRIRSGTGYTVSKDNDLDDWMALPYQAENSRLCQQQATGLCELAKAVKARDYVSLTDQERNVMDVGVEQLCSAQCGLSNGSKTFMADSDARWEKRKVGTVEPSAGDLI